MTIHLRYAGQSHTVEAPGVQPAEAVPYLTSKGYLPLDHYPVVVDRHPDGVVVRPPAVFG